MEIHDAIELLRDAVGGSAGVWADLGAGTGTFTRALISLLAGGSTIYAVDDDAGAVRALRGLPSTRDVRVIAVKADFTQPLPSGINDAALDGILLANALHFIRDGQDVLERLVEGLRPGGRVVLVEYDRRAPSRWVPYPIPASRWPDLAAGVGLTGAKITATRPSEYQGIMYVGTATKAGGGSS
jgi:SAM-dependent methyltransferase